MSEALFQGVCSVESRTGRNRPPTTGETHKGKTRFAASQEKRGAHATAAA
ncbi:hypothetical protein [Paraburkholderia tropica]|nr:hypothetical protein [Paraburkholderia tropica]